MSTRAPRVLLVSGDRALLRQLSRFLDLFGYPSRQAAEAATACSLLADDPPDVLLADWEVPSSSGLELARLVRTSAYEGHCVYAVLIKENPTSNELVQALEAGVDDFLARPIIHGELLARLRAAARTIAHQRGMRDRGRRDPLTGAAGPVALEEHLAKRLAAACREARPLACVAANLDCLSRINSRFGKGGGDAALLAVGRQLRELCVPDDVLGRNRGGEFCVVLDGTSEARAVGWAERARAVIAELEIAELAIEDSAREQVTASFGVAVRLPETSTAEQLLTRASQAVKMAKWSGRNCVVRDGEFEAETKLWQSLAAPGRLFDGTMARDVMNPCLALLGEADSVGTALGIFDRTGIQAVPVTGRDGRLAGLLSPRCLPQGHLAEGSRERPLSEFVQRDVASLDENASFKQLFEAFLTDASTELVITQSGVPTGVVTRAGLASLIEPLSPDVGPDWPSR